MPVEEIVAMAHAWNMAYEDTRVLQTEPEECDSKSTKEKFAVVDKCSNEFLHLRAVYLALRLEYDNLLHAVTRTNLQSTITSQTVFVTTSCIESLHVTAGATRAAGR